MKWPHQPWSFARAVADVRQQMLQQYNAEVEPPWKQGPMHTK